ncbi:MAG: ATP-binding protein [Oligoflexales bacterium]
MGQLLDKILNSKPSELARSRARRCALSYQHTCCHQKGYKIMTDRPVTYAKVCHCVEACQSCHGRALIVDDQGQARSCTKPSPVQIVHLINKAHIPVRYASATFDTFSHHAIEARHTAHNLRTAIRTFDPKHSRGMILSGSVGIGKTYLLVAAARALIERGLSVRFIDFIQLLADIRDAYSDGQSDKSVMNELMSVDVLLVDELGKGRNSEFEHTIIDQLIMGRYNQGKPIIATTNYILNKKRMHRIQQERDFTSMNSGQDFELLETRVGPLVYSRLKEICDFIEVGRSKDLRELAGQDALYKPHSQNPNHSFNRNQT